MILADKGESLTHHVLVVRKKLWRDNHRTDGEPLPAIPDPGRTPIASPASAAFHATGR